MDKSKATQINRDELKVFDRDGNPIEAAILVDLAEVDCVPCLVVQGEDFYAREVDSASINAADDVRFCVPLDVIDQLRGAAADALREITRLSAAVRAGSAQPPAMADALAQVERIAAHHAERTARAHFHRDAVHRRSGYQPRWRHCLEPPARRGPGRDGRLRGEIQGLAGPVGRFAMHFESP